MDRKPTFAGAPSTKRAGECLLKFEPNLRGQEATGSSLAVPTKNLLISDKIRRFFLFLVQIYLLEIFAFPFCPKQDPYGKFQEMPGRLA